MISLSTAAASLTLLYVFTLLRRLYFSSLSKFPGPRAAAASTWYRAYYDMYLGGCWVDHLHELHSTYGPVVRVGPNELSFSDPLAYGDIYASGSTNSKDPVLYHSFDTDYSTFSTLDTPQALKGRLPMAPFFSRRAILRLENVIQSHVDKLVEKLSEYEEANRPANLHRAFRSATFDLISAYCFAMAPNTLDAPNFEDKFIVNIEPTMVSLHMLKHFPLVRRILVSLPFSVAIQLSPESGPGLENRLLMLEKIDKVLKDSSTLSGAEHPTIFHSLLEHTSQAGHKPSRLREILRDEGLILGFAGSDTVGTTCTAATTYLLRDEMRRKRLVDELKSVWPDKETHKGYETLEKLPYLTAVIKEALRLGAAAPAALPRVIGPNGTKISGISIAPDTVVSVGPTLVHLNPDIFYEPNKFIPERWLDTASSSKLDKFLVAFSRGPRACPGINLAWCEMYLIIGHVFRKLSLSEDLAQPADLHFREYFFPVFPGNKLHAYIVTQDS